MNSNSNDTWHSSQHSIGRLGCVRSFVVCALIISVGFLVGVSVFAVFGESGVEAQGQEAG